MTYDPQKLLALCKILSKGTTSVDVETAARTVISRAYYSAFLYAREYLKAKYHIRFTGTGIDHGIVERSLMNRVDRMLGSTIRLLRENRTAADYNLDNPAWCPIRHRHLNFNQYASNDNIRLADTIINGLP